MSCKFLEADTVPITLAAFPLWMGANFTFPKQDSIDETLLASDSLI